MFKDYKDIVSVKELCEMLDICETRAYAMLRDNCFKYRKLGRVYKIQKQSVIDYLNQ